MTNFIKSQSALTNQPVRPGQVYYISQTVYEGMIGYRKSLTGG